MAEKEKDYQYGDQIDPHHIVLAKIKHKDPQGVCPIVFGPGSVLKLIGPSDDYGREHLEVIRVIIIKSLLACNFAQAFAKFGQSEAFDGDPFANIIATVYKAGVQDGQAKLADAILQMDDKIAKVRAGVDQLRHSDPSTAVIGDLVIESLDLLQNAYLETFKSGEE